MHQTFLQSFDFPPSFVTYLISSWIKALSIIWIGVQLSLSLYFSALKRASCSIVESIIVSIAITILMGLLACCQFKWFVQIRPKTSHQLFLYPFGSRDGLYLLFVQWCILFVCFYVLYPYIQTVYIIHALVVGGIAWYCFFRWGEYSRQANIICQTPPFLILSKVIPCLLIALRRALASVVLSYYYSSADRGLFSSAYHLVVDAFIVHFWMMMSFEVLSVYALRPFYFLAFVKDDNNIQNVVQALNYYEKGSFEEKFNCSSQTLDCQKKSSSRDIVLFLNERYQKVKQLLQGSDSFVMSQTLEKFRYQDENVLQRLHSFGAYASLSKLCAYDITARKQILNSYALWNAVFVACTNFIDAFTFRLNLAIEQNTKQIKQNLANPLSHSPDRFSRELWKAASKDLTNIEMLVLYSMEMELQKNSVEKQKQPQTIKDKFHQVSPIEEVLYRLQSYGTTTTEQMVRSEALNSGSQQLLWSMEILATLVSSSRSEDKQGIIQHSVSGVLCSLLACKQAIDQISNIPGQSASSTTSSRITKEAISSAINRAIYKIVITFYSELHEFQLPKEYAKALQVYTNF